MNYNINLVLAKPVSSTHTQVFVTSAWAWRSLGYQEAHLVMCRARLKAVKPGLPGPTCLSWAGP